MEKGKPYLGTPRDLSRRRTWIAVPKLPPQRVSLTCPVCGAPIQADVYGLLDVGQEPDLKARLLRGRINVTRCAACGSEGVIAAPVMYHDPGKELLLVYIPPETNLNDQEQQHLIGNLTNLIMAYLPPEKRRAYLLVPKVLLTYQSLLETVLQAEGVTPEMMAAQRARMQLLDRLEQAMGEEERLQALVAEVDDRLDFEFFATLGAYIEAGRQDGREDRARALEGLRERLLEVSTYGRKLAAQMLVGSPERPPMQREELLEKMLAASSEEELSGLVTWYRSGVDYLFYQMLTERMEAARREGREEEAGRLQELRRTLLELTERLDEEARVALEQATALLRNLLDAAEPEGFVREHLPQFDDAFFIVLGANLQAADEAGEEEVHQRLQKLGGIVLEVAQEKLPPEVRLIRRLLAAPDEAAVTALLEENAALLGEHLVTLVRELAGEVEQEETAERLRQLVERIEGWLQTR